MLLQELQRVPSIYFHQLPSDGILRFSLRETLYLRAQLISDLFE